MTRRQKVWLAAWVASIAIFLALIPWVMSEAPT